MSNEAIQYINHYGYTAIFILIFLQEIGVPNPVPNELVLLFSGYLTYTHVLFLPYVLLSAITADLIGATILYGTFYFFGAYILSHKPKWLPISTAKINSLSQKVSTGGIKSVFLGRLTPFIRGYVSVIAGLLQIKPRQYLAVIVSTAMLVCGAYIIAGRLLGPYWALVAAHIGKVKYGVLAIVVIAVLWIVIRRVKSNAKIKKTEGEESAGSQSNRRLKIHMVSETAYVTKGQGVHTAFIELIELLREGDDVEVVINDEGTGDIFHSHTYGPYYFWMGRKYKGRRILTVHVIPDSIKGSLPLWKYLIPLSKSYFKMVYSYADVLVSLSPMVEQAIRSTGAKTPIVSIGNPIFPTKWRRTAENRKKGRDLLGLNEQDIVVLGVGQLQDRKGVEDFIDIGEAIPNANFVWVGGRPFGIFTEGINRIDNRIENASANIRFAGMFDLQDMPAIYAAADIFLFPSYQENCPLAPLEAAACGMPVIYRDLKEYVLLYNHPYLKAENTADFIGLTKRLTSDRRFYEDATNISAKLVTQFDKNMVRAKLIELYKNIMHRSNTPG